MINAGAPLSKKASGRAAIPEKVVDYRPNLGPRSMHQCRTIPRTCERVVDSAQDLGVLRVPASQQAANIEMVIDCTQNFEGAPRASVSMHYEHREVCRFRTKFGGCSACQRHDTPPM